MSEGIPGMDLKSIQGLASQSKSAPDLRGKKGEELMKAAKEFEGLFTNMVMQKMRDMVPESEVFGSQKVKFFETMLFEEYSQMTSSSKGIGLADQIYKQMSRNLALQDATESALAKPTGVKADEN